LTSFKGEAFIIFVIQNFFFLIIIYKMSYKYVPRFKYVYRPRKKIGYLKNRIDNNDIDNIKTCSCNCHNNNAFISPIIYRSSLQYEKY